ncbi:MAG: hypothetical protein V4641_03360 [Pseudomonadota bacterium]
MTETEFLRLIDSLWVKHAEQNLTPNTPTLTGPRFYAACKELRAALEKQNG